MSAGDEDVQQRTIPSFIGPLSVLGVCLGMISWMVPLFYEALPALFIGVPVSGLVMMALPVVPLRQLGTGLVASVLVWPFTLLGVLIFSGTLD